MISGSTFLGCVGYFYYGVRKELDFVLQRENGEYLGIEGKYKSKVSSKDISSINSVKEYLILSKGEFEVGENAIIVPIYVFLSLQ